MIYCPECKQKTAKLLKLGDNVKPIYKIECEHCGVATIGCEDLEWAIDTWAWLNSMSPRDYGTKPEPDPNNPYTDFAKEMSLLHEALKAEGFKDAMVDILAAMTPEVWRKVQFEEQKDFLHKTLGINVDDFVARCNDDNKKPRPENWGGGAMT